MTEIITRLRDYDSCHDGDVDLAADMLEFFFGQMQSHSLHMDGTAGYRFRGGWPLSYVRATTREEAVLECLRLIEEAKKDSNATTPKP